MNTSFPLPPDPSLPPAFPPDVIEPILPAASEEEEKQVETPPQPAPDRQRAIAECTGSTAHLPPSFPPSQCPQPGWTPSPAQ